MFNPSRGKITSHAIETQSKSSEIRGVRVGACVGLGLRGISSTGRRGKPIDWTASSANLPTVPPAFNFPVAEAAADELLQLRRGL